MDLRLDCGFPGGIGKIVLHAGSRILAACSTTSGRNNHNAASYSPIARINADAIASAAALITASSGPSISSRTLGSVPE